MSVKRVFVVTALLAGSVGLLSAQSYYDDDIYYNPSKEVKQKTVKTVTAPSKTVVDYPAADTYMVYNTGEVRDVDEYNRRTPAEVDTASISQGENFEYTRRIERFYDPQVVVSLNDPELVEYYYASAQPEVNIIVGSSTFTDLWLMDWGWYSPYSYSNWMWNSWYWGYPYYGWRGPSWYFGWYPGPYPGPYWHPSYYPGYRPGPAHPGGGNRRWASGTAGGRRTVGPRYNSGRGDNGYRPGSNSGYKGGNNRRGQGTWQNNSSNHNDDSRRGSYNSGNTGSRGNSGFSSGGSGGGHRGGFGGGGSRSGGGSRGGGRR